VSHFAIINAFKKTKILIPYGARCCRNHFKNDLINDDAIKLLVPYAQTYVLNDNNIGSFKILFDALTDDAETNDLFHKFKNINHINEALCIQNTCYNAMEFLAIYESIVKNNEFNMRETSNRSISQALVVYLYWLKTGSDQESIANHFGSVSRRQAQFVSKYVMF
jgi:hypothetical protein